MKPHELIGVSVAALALIVSILAAYYSVYTQYRISTSEHQSSQNIKSSTALLLANLRSIIYKSVLANTGHLQASISLEQAEIQRFITSPAGFAYASWAGKKSADAGSDGEEWRVFFIYLHEIASASEVGLAANRAVRIELLMDKMKPTEYDQIAELANSYTDSVQKYFSMRDHDPLMKAIFDMHAQSDLSNMPQKEINARMKFLRENDVNDPDVDLWYHLTSDAPDTNLIQEALGRGAKINSSLGSILAKYHTLIDQYASDKRK